MSGTRLRLKRASGWFAAGQEVQNALSLLSDNAFKLFLWLCLHVDRSCGRMAVSVDQISRALRKTESEIQDGLEELWGKRVCCQPKAGPIEIADSFWPYERKQETEGDDNVRHYLHQIQQVLCARASVRCAFTAADQQLALEFHRRAIPAEQVQRAIVLGCLRKQVTMINRGAAMPITTLHYFTPVLEEVQRLEISSEYWNYVARKLEDLERRWSDSKARAAETK